MLSLFNDIRNGYIATALAGIIIPNIVISDHAFYVSCIMIAWTVLCIVVFNKIAKNRITKLNELYFNCRVREYIAANERFLAKSRKKAQIDFFKLQLYAGYSALGDIDRAGEILLSVQPNFGAKANAAGSLCAYYSNLTHFFTRNGDLEKAQEALDSLKALLQNPDIKDKQRNTIIRTIEDRSFYLNIKKGNYDGAKNHYLIALSTAKHLLEKVSISYILADICRHGGDIKEAEGFLRYVIDNGAESYYVASAKEQLEQLPKHTQRVNAGNA